MRTDADTAAPPDYLGAASVICGALAAGGCFATCIPYIGSLFLFASMFLSLVGTLVGVLGISDRRRTGSDETLAWAGTVLSGVVLALWIVYWLFVFFAMFMLIGGLVLFAIAENL